MPESRIHLLVIEDEDFDVRRIRNTLRAFEDKIIVKDIVSSGRDALEYVRKGAGGYDVVIMDYQIAGGLYGEELITEVKKLDPTVQIIVVTKKTTQQTDLYFANQLLESGAFWFCTKYPVDIEEYIYQPNDFALSIMNANEKKKLEQKYRRSKTLLDRKIEDIHSKHPVIGASKAIQQVKEIIDRYANTDAIILVTGESGTGKELVAMNIHLRSKRRYENFVTINCGAIPNELVESELFGYEKGAFTGAKEKKPGLFEQANGGTVFLDEIGDLPISAQAKLLRVLQDGEIDKIGRKKKYYVDVRVIAATNKDLEAAVKKNRFREDLYYRVNVLNIDVPPLRERPQDIPLIIGHLMKLFSSDMGVVSPEITEQAMNMLIHYPWPGNVRELKNIVQRLLLINPNKVTEQDVTRAMGMTRTDESSRPLALPVNDEQILPLRQIEREFRRKYVQFVRQQSQSDAEAATKLGLAPPNYHRICKDLGMK